MSRLITLLHRSSREMLHILLILCMHCRMLGSLPLLPMANLKAIRRIYLPRSEVLLGQVECRTRCTSTWPIKAL
ncbi:hypothetical protein DFH94DRAFT_788378 [Russula ochroleuca]|uniref:Uncharacterized protein n=1 Tax=Russula ochroleuca TaxID=152965 RepID=A0A9P5JTB9_9AGAM|nr:hypothetical protein DFH94DRAFT_788378 [Russula ochroleuca]